MCDTNNTTQARLFEVFNAGHLSLYIHDTLTDSSKFYYLTTHHQSLSISYNPHAREVYMQRNAMQKTQSNTTKLPP